jgi:release factor glutamine methyltransferase
VDTVLTWSHGTGRSDLVALDVGTGSGAIALSLLVEGPFARVVATDVSGAALELAASNAVRAGVQERLELREGSLYEPIGEDPACDVIVANLPYVPETDRETLMPEVVAHEPEEALFAGPDGLDLIRQITAGASDQLKPGGLLALEVGLTQAEVVAGLMREHGLVKTRIVRDLAGRERIVMGENPGE